MVKKKINKKSNKSTKNRELSNSKSQSEQKEESFIIKWLKRIFSVQTLMVVATIAAAFFGYRSYSDNHPSQISLEFNCIQGSINTEKITEYESLLFPFQRHLKLEDHTVYNSVLNSPFPAIVNKSDKSIKNFKVEVLVHLSQLRFHDSDVNQDFEVTKYDTTSTTGYNVYFKYKFDVLHAKSSMSVPLNSVYLPDTIPFSDNFHNLLLFFKITYDGINEPIRYRVKIASLFNEDNFLYKYDKTIDKYLTQMLEDIDFSHIYEYNFENSVVTIGNYIRQVKIFPLDSSNKTLFSVDDSEKYKADVKKYFRNNLLHELRFLRRTDY